MAADRPLPYNLDAERAVLGAILLENQKLRVLTPTLAPADFLLPEHRRVFQQMVALAEAEEAIDLITLTDELRRRGELDAAGGIFVGLLCFAVIELAYQLYLRS